MNEEECPDHCGWLGASLRDPGALANAPGSRRLAPSHPAQNRSQGRRSFFKSLGTRAEAGVSASASRLVAGGGKLYSEPLANVVAGTLTRRIGRCFHPSRPRWGKSSDLRGSTIRAGRSEEPGIPMEPGARYTNVVVLGST